MLLCGLLAGCGRAAADRARPAPPPPRDIEVLTMTPTPVRDTGEYLGTLLSRESVQVLTQVSGYVRKIQIKPGQKVKNGTSLVEVDSREEAAALDTAVAQKTAADARVTIARQNLARAEALHRSGALSTQEYDRLRAELKSAEANSAAAEATIAQRRVQVQFHTIRAPVPGVLGEVSVRVGDFLPAGARLTSISQVDVLEVSAAIPAARARTLAVSSPLEILDDAGNVLLESTVFYVSPEADLRTQLVDVKAVFQNTAGLRPGELVRTKLVYGIREALQVPPMAVTRQSGQPFVFAVITKDGKSVVERRPVTLGPLGEQAYVVEKGLNPGDRIAVSALQSLRDGAAVNPREPVPTRATSQSGTAAAPPTR